MTSTNVFSTDVKQYHALAYFEVAMEFENSRSKFEETYGLHVSVLQESDGLFYALCLEWNQVTCAESPEMAINDMHELISDITRICMEDSKDWEVLYDEMSEEYFTIFHQLKSRYNRDKARRLTRYLQNDGDAQQSVVTDFEKIHTFKIKTKLGNIRIDKQYEINVSNPNELIA